MSKIVKLAAIPTLRHLYASSVSKPVPDLPEFPPESKFLDRVSLWQGDITTLEVDAIVNAANKSLLGGGGVDGAIHRAAGPGLLEECETLNGAKTGEAKITGGYELPARYVVHTVGPIYAKSKVNLKAQQLAACYSRSLDLAAENSLTSIAFCSVSTGVYGYPVYDATDIALRTTREYLDTEKGEKLERVIFVVFSNKDKRVYEDLLPLYFPPDGAPPSLPPVEEEAEAESLPKDTKESSLRAPEPTSGGEESSETAQPLEVRIETETTIETEIATGAEIENVQGPNGIVENKDTAS